MIEICFQYILKDDVDDVFLFSLVLTFTLIIRYQSRYLYKWSNWVCLKESY